MARRISRKELKQDEVLEAAVEARHWIEEHWATVVKLAAALVVAVLLIFAWVAWARHSRQKAEARLADALRTFEEVETVGFTDRIALEALLEEFEGISGGTPAKVARLYRGVALHQLDRNDEAMEVLEQVIADSGDLGTLEGTAHAVLANVYQASGRTDDAVALLDGLLDQDEPPVPADQALLQIGRIFREAGRVDEAREYWQRVLDEHPTGTAAQQARDLLNS